jgi:hypothetical protein
MVLTTAAGERAKWANNKVTDAGIDPVHLHELPQTPSPCLETFTVEIKTSSIQVNSKARAHSCLLQHYSQ